MATNDSYSKMSLEGDASQERLCELLLRKFQIEQEINSIANSDSLPPSFCQVTTTGNYKLTVSYEKIHAQKNTSVIELINRLLDRFDDSCFQNEYSVEDIKGIFEGLINNEQDDFALQDAHRKFIKDFTQKRTKYCFGYLCLQPFLHVIGYLIAKDIICVGASEIINNILFLDYDPKDQETMRTYIQKGKNNALSQNQKALINIFL